tara:strand:+ start:1383 stop:2588 length:1206 start_codon:yes stop_codon:yes gene_type:complete
MVKNKYETILDYGSSKIRAGVIDIESTLTKFFIEENCENSFKIKNLKFDDPEKKIYKVIKYLEKKLNYHLNDINLMVDSSDFTTIDVCLKKNFNNRLVQLNDFKNLLQELNLLIKNNYQNLKILHFIITKINIDKKELSTFPEENLNCNELIFEAKFICLHSFIHNELIEQFKNKFISIKKIYCSSYVKSFFYKKYFNDYNYKFFLDIGFEKTCLTIYNDNKLNQIKYIPIGGNHITKDISKVLKISNEEAEKIKKNIYKLGMTFSTINVENKDTDISNLFINSINKNISVDLLKKIIFSRIDEIINLIFDQIHHEELVERKNKSVLVFTGEGSKILNKKLISLIERFDCFKEINFFEESTALVCESGYNFELNYNPQEISLVPKKLKKTGFFEKFFYFFK